MGAGNPAPQLAPLQILSEIVKDVGPVSSETRPVNIYPELLSYVVRVNNLAKSSVGSGVVIWSGLDSQKRAHTFILTNYHVLPVGLPGTVDIVTYLNFRDVESVKTYPCVSVIQNIGSDLALLEIISTDRFPNTAKFITSEAYEQLTLYTDVFIVGSGLGNPPFVSSGKIFNFGEDKLFVNGFSVWGFSGGGVFDRQGRLVAINSQIAIGGMADVIHPITNMSLSVPVNVICGWLLETKYKFIVNPSLGSLDDAIRVKKLY